MDEFEKMKQGLWYDANNNPTLIKQRRYAQNLCVVLNQSEIGSCKYKSILEELIKDIPDSIEIIPPFMCDYGYNITIGENTFINSNCYMMDCATITIGNNCFIGPFCGFYTASHPLQYKYRNQGLEKASPIVVGDNCWFGANVSIMGGVTIGSGVVIGAGSVVTSDIGDNVVVAGVPAKVIKSIDQLGELE